MSNIIKILLILILCILLIDLGLSLVLHGGLAPLGFAKESFHGFGCGIGQRF